MFRAPGPLDPNLVSGRFGGSWTPHNECVQYSIYLNYVVHLFLGCRLLYPQGDGEYKDKLLYEQHQLKRFKPTGWVLRNCWQYTLVASLSALITKFQSA